MSVSIRRAQPIATRIDVDQGVEHIHLVGRGRPHGEATLPPMMQALRTFTQALTSYITAEAFVGNLDDLRNSHH
jgi:hypothetical protein